MTAMPAHKQATMLVGRDRIFYTGRLRRSIAPRLLGALSIYAVPQGEFEIAIDGALPARARMAVVPAYVPHQLRPPPGRIFNLLVEPESVGARTTDMLLAAFGADGPALPLLARFGAADEMIRARPATLRTGTSDFDRLFFGADLGARTMDPRVSEILRLMVDTPNEQRLAAEDYAVHVGLSVSRMLRLFRTDTGIPFRKLRMWKRARRFLDQANGTARLTDVALDLGYPDSSHFSNSIRRIFGMGPGLMRAGARDMQIRPCAGYMLYGT
jgi:AraC-like DNA-binding protein